MAWGIYASPGYLEAQGGALADPQRLDGHALIGWEEAAAGIRAADWLAKEAPPESFVYRTNSLVNQAKAAKAGVGVALLPCYLGDSEGGLVRAFPDPLPNLATELWIVTHADLKGTARVRAFFDVVGERLALERDLFEGRGSKSVCQ